MTVDAQPVGLLPLDPMPVPAPEEQRCFCRVTIEIPPGCEDQEALLNFWDDGSFDINAYMEIPRDRSLRALFTDLADRCGEIVL